MEIFNGCQQQMAISLVQYEYNKPFQPTWGHRRVEDKIILLLYDIWFRW